MTGIEHDGIDAEVEREPVKPADWLACILWPIATLILGGIAGWWVCWTLMHDDLGKGFGLAERQIVNQSSTKANSPNISGGGTVTILTGSCSSPAPEAKQ